ncbi:hypothetical protein [Haliangium sp.]|uniref:TRM11 family SAM-dependent methyltransferase n=1 Tax=Haliangium sp. TaxID=2663208 RepID=UPI003D10B269
MARRPSKPRSGPRPATPDRRRSREGSPPTGDKGRRAFSTASADSPVDSFGEPGPAAALASALRAPSREDPDHPIAGELTHALHTYPARMHPATARGLVGLVLDLAPRPQAMADEDPTNAPPPAVLDPFCGAGTVLVEARRAGARAVGVDANPLAVLLAQAKTWSAPPPRRALLREHGRTLARAALAEGKAARRADYEPPPLRVLRGVDPVQRSRQLEGWFPPHVRRELEHLARSIDDLRRDDAELAEVLTVVLSSILYKVSRRASDTDPRRIERHIARGAAARLFEQRVELLCTGLAGFDAAASPPAEVHLGDARHLDEVAIADGSIAAAITSPPYAGTYDYAHQHRLRLDFLGLPTASFHAAELGSRQQFSGDAHNRRRARRRYKRALGAALTELARVLVPAGPAVVMLGDSVAGDRAMWADEVVREAAEQHFALEAWAWQERPKLGALEREAFGDRPKRECLFLMTRRAQADPLVTEA